MKRTLIASILATATAGLLVTGTALSSGRQENTYRLRIELTGIPNNSNPSQTVRLEPTAATDVPIRYEFKQPSGATFSFQDHRAIVPSAEQPKGDEAVRQSETIPVGPRLQVRVEPFGDESVIVDATLSNTQLPKHEVEERTLHAIADSARFVEPVKLGTAVTFQWPGDSDDKMKVTLTVERGE